MEGDEGQLIINGVPAGRLGAWTVRASLAGITLTAEGSFATAFRGAASARAALVSRGERPSPRSPGSPGARLLVEGTLRELTSTRLVLTGVREIVEPVRGVPQVLADL